MSIIRNFIAKGLFKKSGVIANKKSVDFSVNALEQRLKNAGVNPNEIKSENELNQILSFVKQAENAAFDQRYRVIAGNTPEGRKITDKLFGRQGEVVDMTGKKIDTSQGIMGGKSVKELMESGQVQKGTEGLKKSKKITDRDLFKDANQRLRGPVKGKMDMGEFGKVDVETDYSAAINRKEFFDTKAKNMYDKTVKTGPEFFKAQKEQILNTINRKKKEMVPPTHSNYKLLKKSLQDQEDALEAIKITEDLGGNENMFNYLRTQNIADYKSKPIKRSNYVRNETEQEIADRLNKQNQDSLQNLKNKLDDPEDMADGGVAGLLGERTGYNKGLKVYPKITASKSNQGLGDGKNVDLQDLTYGGTLMYDQGPFSAGIEYLKGKDKFDFKDKDDTLFKDTTDRDLANLILMMKLKDGSIKFKGNKDNQMINFSKSFAQGGRTGFRGGGADAGGKSSPGGGTFGGGGGGGSGNARENYRTQQYKKSKTTTSGGGGKTTTTPKTKTTTTPKTKMRGFPTTRTLQPSLFERMNTHFVNNQKLKDAVARGDITQEDYNVLGGYDAKQTLNFGPVMTGITSAAYNAVQSALGPKFSGGNQPLFDGASDVGRNVFGSTLDPNSAYAEQYNKIMNLADGGPARQNFAMGKRAFLKFLASGAAGIAGLKSGLLGFGGKQATKKAVTETVKQSAGSGTPPPYFFKLVEKIRARGNDTLATKDKAIAKKYKDYTMQEDFGGNIEIIKKGDNPNEEVYIKYTADDVELPNKKGFTKAQEYEEFTARPDVDGKMKDVEQGVPDEVVQEGTVFEDNMTEFGMTKKADGGRIGFKFGGKGILQFLKNLKIKQSGDDLKDFLSKRQFLKDAVGNTEKNRKARQLAKIKEDVDNYMKQYKGYQFPSDEQIKIDLEKRMQPILNKNRKLNATGGLANMLGE